MIGFVGALVVVAIVAAIVIPDAAPRPATRDRPTLAPFDALREGSGNGHSSHDAFDVSVWSEVPLPGGAGPSVGLDLAPSAVRTATARAGSLDLIPAGAPSSVGSPLLRPDPERFIQT